MGCDGGSIPTRCELVKEKEKPKKVDAALLHLIRWSTCALSEQPLKEPLVACELGNIYNKEAILLYLMEKKTDPKFSHIRSLKDLITLRFTPNPAFKPKEKEGDEQTAFPWICPITLVEPSQKTQFIVLRSCGCVFSEKALREVPTTNCLSCQKPFTNEELIYLNPNEEQTEELKQRMEQRRANQKDQKKEKKEKKEKKHKKGEKSEKGEKEEKTEKGDKTEKAEPSEKSEKSEKLTMKDKPVLKVSTTSSSSSATAASSASNKRKELDAARGNEANKKAKLSSVSPSTTSSSSKKAAPSLKYQDPSIYASLFRKNTASNFNATSTTIGSAP